MLYVKPASYKGFDNWGVCNCALYCTANMAISAIPTGGGGGGGGVPPLATACVPPFRVTEKNVFRISRDDKTAENDGKKNNDIEI